MALFALFYGASIWLVQTHINPKDNLLKSLELLRSVNQSENSIFGDSHSAFNYAVPDDYLNLAFPSENIEDMNRRVNIFYSKNKCGNVILPADPHLFSSYRIDAGVKSYFQVDPSGLLISDYHKPKLPNYWKAYLSGALEDKVFLGDGEANQKIRFHTSGWQEVNGVFAEISAEKRRNIALARVERHTPEPKHRRPKTYSLYESMIDNLLSKQCRVCMVTSPVSYDYYEASKQNSAFAESLQYFRSLAHQKGLKYVNNFGAYSGHEHLPFFHDEDHLNGVIAKQYTRDTINACFH